MVIKIIPFFALFAFVLSCQTSSDIAGSWKLEIQLQDKILPVIIELKENNNSLVGYMHNSDEIIQLEGKILNKKFELQLAASYAQLKGELIGNKLKGIWVRTNKENYQIPFTATRTKQTELFEQYEAMASKFNLNKKWKIHLSEESYGLGLFKQVGSRVSGSILTTTGDYRYLDGYIKDNICTLYGFDGVFSFVIEMKLDEDSFTGMIYSGKTFKQQISGQRDDHFELADPNQLTSLTSTKPLHSIKIAAKEILLNTGEYQGRAKVIQLFGTWCPNCIDETRFLLNWRKQNKEKLSDVKFIALAFERSKDKKTALKNLKRISAKLGIDYALELVDFDKSIKPSNILPIDKMRAFPTTLYLDRNNKVIKVHTGFSGQATDIYFEHFKQEFNKTINRMISLSN